MARKSATRKRKKTDAVPQHGVVQEAPSVPTGSGLRSLLQQVTQDILAVTYWFDPPPTSMPSPVTVRFSGHRVGVKGRLSSRDRFVQDETIEVVIPGGGPISLTTRVLGISPGSWVVTAHQIETAHPAVPFRSPQDATPTAGPLPLIAQLWYKWAPDTEPNEPIETCPIPLARVPGILPGSWAVLVTLGILIALALQLLLISRTPLSIGLVWAVTLVALVAGSVGAKVWFLVLHARTRRQEGWCIQGFLTGTTGASAIMLALLHVPPGVFLDTIAPGLLLGMAVGRVGCFFGGCCGGPPTASRLGVWSSDQRVGARRLPTQLLESALALALGLLMLVMVLNQREASGAFFFGGLSAYTLGRQGILHLRAEPRQTRHGTLVISVLAALVLTAVVLFLLTR